MIGDIEKRNISLFVSIYILVEKDEVFDSLSRNRICFCFLTN